MGSGRMLLTMVDMSFREVFLAFCRTLKSLLSQLLIRSHRAKIDKFDMKAPRGLLIGAVTCFSWRSDSIVEEGVSTWLSLDEEVLFKNHPRK